MKKLQILTLAVSAALVSTLAFAQADAPRPPNKLDANGDGAISKTEAAAHPRLMENFDKLDKNKDGKLDRGEMPRHRDGMRGPRGEGMREGRGGMPAMDSDGDGRISRAEMQAGKADMDARFAKMDVNKDGYIDKADMQARRDARRTECFTKADADKNGQLSRAEFDALGAVCHGPGQDGPRRGGLRDRMPENNPNPGPLPPPPPPQR